MMDRSDLVILKDLVRLIHQRFQQHGDEIGQVLCTTLQSLMETLIEKHNLNVPVTHEHQRNPYPEWIKEAIRLRKEGLSYEKIGKMVRKSKATVRRWLNEIGRVTSAIEAQTEHKPVSGEQALWAQLEQKIKVQ